MASTKSDQITNITATPPAMNRVAVDGGRLRVKTGTFETVAADFDADGDVLRLCRVPANAVIHQIWIANDDLDTGTDSVVNVGLQDKDGNIKDEDVYATLLTQFQAATAFTNVAFEARGINLAGQRVYQDAGDSDESEGEYEICIYQTATVSGAAAGTVSYIVVYSVD